MEHRELQPDALRLARTGAGRGHGRPRLLQFPEAVILWRRLRRSIREGLRRRIRRQTNRNAWRRVLRSADARRSRQSLVHRRRYDPKQNLLNELLRELWLRRNGLRFWRWAALSAGQRRRASVRPERRAGSGAGARARSEWPIHL